jgi:hypothetical protein
MLRRPIALFLTVLLASCASTSFHSTWKDPDAGVLDYSGKKIAAIFVSEDESIRRAAEDTLAGELSARGAEGLAAYRLVSFSELSDKAAVHAKLTQAGCSGVVVMRVSGKEQQISSYPTTYAGSRYSSFSGWGWHGGYGNEVRSDTIVSVETLVYSLERDKLLWAGTSETFNPSKLEEFVVDLANAVAKEMESEGLLP